MFSHETIQKRFSKDGHALITVRGLNYNSYKGAEGQAEQRRGLRTKALMRDLRTRLECRHRVFVRTGKTLVKEINSLPAGLEPATLRSIAHDFPTAPSPHHGKS